MAAAMDVSWLAALPVLLLTCSAVLVMLADLFTSGPDREGLGWIGIVGLGITAIACTTLWNQEISAFSGALLLDRYSLFFALVFCVTTALSLLLAMGYLENTEVRTGDYYTLVMFSTVGMLLMASAGELMVMFLALEVMSIPAYALAGIARGEIRSNEASLKYFLMGAFASAFLLFGIALVFGATGTTTLAEISGRIGGLQGDARSLFTAGVALLIVGFGFKIAAAPFHLWTPDVYEGSPSSVTAFMAVGIKTAAFAAFARIFLHTFAVSSAEWSNLLWIMAAVTMTVGNVTAITQTNIKRMLAYSSVAHAGYLLVGMVVGGDAGGSGLLFYLLGYGVTSLGAFAIIAAVGRAGSPNEELSDYNGLAWRSPFLAACMAVFMLSLAGIPPLGGFVGKVYLFSAAVNAGYVGLTIIGVLNSLVSMYYYAGVLVRMYMSEGGAEIDEPSSRPYLFATALLTLAAVVALGVFPSSIYELARQSIASL